MTTPTTAGGSLARRVNRPLRIVVVSVVAALAAMLAAVAFSASQLHWWTPSAGGTTEHTSTFGPAVLAAVLDLTCLAAAIGVLVRSVSRRGPFRAFWPLLAAVVIVSVAVTGYALVAPTPSF